MRTNSSYSIIWLKWNSSICIIIEYSRKFYYSYPRILVNEWARKTMTFRDKNFENSPSTFGTNLPNYFQLFKMHKGYLLFKDVCQETILFINLNLSQYVNWNNHVLKQAYQNHPKYFCFKWRWKWILFKKQLLFCLVAAGSSYALILD